MVRAEPGLARPQYLRAEYDLGEVIASRTIAHIWDARTFHGSTLFCARLHWHVRSFLPHLTCHEVPSPTSLTKRFPFASKTRPPTPRRASAARNLICHRGRLVSPSLWRAHLDGITSAVFTVFCQKVKKSELFAANNEL